jgi:hypothetical protein
MMFDFLQILLYLKYFLCTEVSRNYKLIIAQLWSFFVDNFLSTDFHYLEIADITSKFHNTIAITCNISQTKYFTQNF